MLEVSGVHWATSKNVVESVLSPCPGVVGVEANPVSQTATVTYQPIASGVFQPAFGLVLRPEIAALSMFGSSFLVAVNALLLKRLKLPTQPPTPQAQPAERLLTRAG